MRKKLHKKVFKALIEGRKFQEIRDAFNYYNMVDLALMVEECSVDQILMLFKILKREISAEMFTYLSNNKQEELINAFTSLEIKGMLENLYSDDIIDFLEELPSNLVKKILQSASEDQRSEINLLLSYPEDSAGYMMTTDFVELKVNDTVKRAITRIKTQGKVAETISNCYIVNENRTLVGSIRLREILFADEDEMISEIMDSDVITVMTSDDREVVANVFKKYDYSVIPVVNDEEKLIGIITADDIIDVIYEETTEDIQKIAAITPMEGSYTETNIIEMAKSRVSWLIILMVSATFTGLIIQGYEQTLTLIPALAASMPMIMSTAGNAGSQSSIMVIRGISVDNMSIKDFWLVIWKELKIGLVIGLILFIVNVIRLMIFTPSVSIEADLVISLTVFITILMANITGGLLPLFALIFKQDPAAMASPLITTIVDALALIVYFKLAMQFLSF
ncbi:MAG TPA: magnesium transporter [Erysipelotrichaceae bacterium]|nr:magnesium transporter [Erysipelotrichaceae bacterium]